MKHKLECRVYKLICCYAILPFGFEDRTRPTLVAISFFELVSNSNLNRNSCSKSCIILIMLMTSQHDLE